MTPGYSRFGYNLSDNTGPCDEDQVGVIDPFSVPCEVSDKMFNKSYSSVSPFSVDLTLVRTDCDDASADPAKVRFMCVYNKLVQSPVFKNLFLNLFGGNQTQFNAKFEIVDQLFATGNPSQQSYAKAEPVITATGVNVTIKINKQMLVSGNSNVFSSNIMVAKVILHECLHAYLEVKKINANQGAPIPGIENSTLATLLNEYIQAYPALQADHNFMINYMIPTMSQCLSQIKELILSESEIAMAEDPTQTYLINQATYQNIPWSWNECFKYLSMDGLNESQYFIDNIQNVALQNDLYLQYNNVSKNNFSKNCN